jgi:hypothetical protein
LTALLALFDLDATLFLTHDPLSSYGSERGA